MVFSNRLIPLIRISDRNLLSAEIQIDNAKGMMRSPASPPCL